MILLEGQPCQLKACMAKHDVLTTVRQGHVCSNTVLCSMLYAECKACLQSASSC